MKIGIPKEIKILEGRVALIPEAAGELVRHGQHVAIQQSAGVLSGYSDDDYRKAGVDILPDAKSIYDFAELIIKVKEPQPAEFDLMRADQILFSYLHLAAEPELTKALQEIGITAIGFETVEHGHSLPLLAPMSDIAGRLSVQIGSNLLQRPNGGRGLLLGGLPAAERGRVVILGGGSAGSNAALMACNIGAEVTVFDPNRDKLAGLRSLGDNVTGLYPFSHAIEEHVRQADLLVGAVLITGQRAPHLVSAELVKRMKPGSVIIDISVDQGGCIETTRPTNYENPTFVWEEVVHFGVTNMPGAVPRSASQALSAALISYSLMLCDPDWEKMPDLASGVNVKGGRIIHPALQ